MRRMISLGYADDDAKGSAKVLAGPEVPVAEQVRLVTGIKTSGSYPSGLARVELCELVVREIGIKVGGSSESKKSKKSDK